MGFFVAAVLAASNGGCVETYYSAGYQGADGYMYLMGIDVIPTVGRSPFIRQCGPPGAGTMVCRRLQVKDGSPSPSALESHPSAPSIRTWEAPPQPPFAADAALPAAPNVTCQALFASKPTHVRVRTAADCPAAGQGAVFRVIVGSADGERAQVEDAGGTRGTIECRCLEAL
jgi:hypothetical protein